METKPGILNQKHVCFFVHESNQAINLTIQRNVKLYTLPALILLEIVLGQISTLHLSPCTALYTALFDVSLTGETIEGNRPCVWFEAIRGIVSRVVWV